MKGVKVEVLIVRVAFVGPFAFYPKGTVPVRMLPIAKVLQQKGHKVSMFLPPYDNLADSGKNFCVDGIDVFNVGVPRRLFLLGYVVVAWRLVNKVLTFRPDVVHVFKPKGHSGLAGMFLVFLKFLKLTKVPIVLDTDDWEGHGGFAGFYLEHGLYSKFMVDFFDFQERWLLKRVDAVTAASKALEDMANDIRVGGGVFYVPNGPSELPRSEGRSINELRKSLGLEEKKVVLLYTRFFEYDIKEAVDVFAEVVSEVKDVKLLVVGKGEFGEENEFLDLIKKRGLLDDVVYVGWVKPEEIRSFIELGDVAIYPFKDTTLNRAKCPGKVVQLMSIGKPIIADKVGQIAEYIEDKKSGILVPQGNIEEFSQWVTKLLHDKDLRKKIGEEAKNRIWIFFAWNKNTEKVNESYNYAINKRV